MTSRELRELYINFFKEKGHAVITSASLIPENDPTVLFNTAGMQPLVPYLMGEKHPAGTRLVDVQKCIRTNDIDDVGDATHLTFFEMLGNWSLGDYFKKESIAWSHELLTKVLKIPQEKISVSVFEGDADAPRDEEAAAIWKSLGYPDERIYFYNKKENWWGPAGATGPCGPDTEIFYEFDRPKCCADCGPACDCGKFVEIWNNVFMQYNKGADGKLTPLAAQCVDTGMGFERMLCILTGANNVYESDLFQPIIAKVESLTGKKYADNVKAFRIISDHMRASNFILGDDKGVAPSNVDQGYILRRLIRRAYRYLVQLGAPAKSMSQIAQIVVDNYGDVYPELTRNRDFIIRNLDREEELFGRTLDSGMKIAGKYLDASATDKKLAATEAFRLYDTYGFPLEFTSELARERNIAVDTEGFARLYAEHQEKSRAGASQKFAGGLADNSEQTTKLHTAAHLMDAALRKVLGDTVFQKGSNITAERLRFDFSFDRKMTPEEIAATEKLVNEAIVANVPVECVEMTVEEAKASGAIGVFGSKYGDKVKVYKMGEFSNEICGGPHAASTGDLVSFKIMKEESSAAGVRRIKATIGG